MKIVRVNRAGGTFEVTEEQREPRPRNRQNQSSGVRRLS